MEELQRHLVRDHIRELHREADARRTATPRAADATSDEDLRPAVRGPAVHATAPVRVRLGHWLIGVGFAVAGADRDHIDRATRHAA